MVTPRFLSQNRVLRIHEHQLLLYSGSPGYDAARLESALAVPKSGMGGDYFHSFPFGMAAAYLFHLAKGHAFVDGNKRTATAAALVFLKQNGYRVVVDPDELANLVLAVTTSQKSKQDAEVFLMEHSQPISQ